MLAITSTLTSLVLIASTFAWFVGTRTVNVNSFDYTVSQTTGGNYTIDYSDYKARLITANEVEEITGNTTFDESKGYYYFDTNTSTRSDTCKSGNTSGCNYGWLYDRTKSNCVTKGCLNNSESNFAFYGYWTSTSAFNTTDEWLFRIYWLDW